MSRNWRAGWHQAAIAGFILALPLYGVQTAAAQNASHVLGQFDFTHNGPNIVSNQGLWTPNAVAVDTSVSPNHLYVADASNHRVLGWRSVAALVNGSPADLVIGQPDFLSWNSQCNNAAVTGATLCFPAAVAVDPNGNLYVVDQGNNRVLEYDTPFTTDTQPDTVFGQGGSFTSSACNLGGSISRFTLCNPTGVATDGAGNVYIADSANSRVLEYNLPLATDTAADRVFGQGGSFTIGACNQGVGTGANTLCDPAGVALDPAGHLYISDPGNFRVLEYDEPLSSPVANLVFGQSDFTSNANPCGALPGPGGLCSPDGVALDGAGNLYISDSSFTRMQEYNTPAASRVTTPNAVFGQPDFNSFLCNNGGVNASGMCQPAGAAADAGNNVFLADFGNQRVLEYKNPLSTHPPNTAAALALGQSALTFNGINAPGANGVNRPGAVALDTSVSPNHLYVADTGNSRVLGWQSVAAFTNGQPADLVLGQPNLVSVGCNQNRVDATGNSLAAANTLCFPNGVAVDGAGAVWVADAGNFRVLKYKPPFGGPAGGQAAILVLGQGGSFTSRVPNNGGVSASSLFSPAGLTVDPAGHLYVSDPVNNRVLEYKHPSTTALAADVVFGQGGKFTGSNCNFDGFCPTTPCQATVQSLCGPSAVAVNALGNLYVADTANNRVLQFPPGSSGATKANLVLGQLNFNANTCTTLCQPQGVALNASGDLFAAAGAVGTIQAYRAPLTDNAPASLLIGSQLCEPDHSGPATLCSPSGIGFDAAQNLYVADTLDHRVLIFNHPSVPTPTPTPRPTSTPKPTATPTATATPRPGTPVISSLPGVVRSGADFNIGGSNFTTGSMVNFFVATATGSVNTGPFRPVFLSTSALNVTIPASNPLGQGVAAVQVVNTDRGFSLSNTVLSLLQGNPELGIPSITSINSAPLAADSTAPGIGVANVQTVVMPGTSVSVGGSGFDTANGVAVDLFCDCTGGKVGPFLVGPGLNLTSTRVVFNLPASGRNVPVTGPGSFVVSNKGSNGSYSKKSNAVSVPIGQRIAITGVSQSAKQVTVLGAGFCAVTVINLFNQQGGTVVNLGGLDSSGHPKIPLTVPNSGQFTFTVPSTAKPGSAYVQALNPPFVPFSSTGNAPAGSFVLH